MPTSDLHNIVPIVSVIRNLQPRAVLDIGCGFGKYGVLLREYLDVWDERVEAKTWQVQLIGIDAFAPYRNPIWDYVYQQVHVGEAQRVLPTLGQFDVILIADVIEHLDRAAAAELVHCCLEHSPVVIVSTPREFCEQGDVNQNPYERHRSAWTASDFPPGVQVVTIPALICDVYVASRASLSPETTHLAAYGDVLYLRSRLKLRRLGPFGWPLSAALRLLARWLT